MKKSILFLAIIASIFVACEQQADKNPTTKPNIEPNFWINTDSECCGVKDPLNTLEWLRAKSQFDEDNENPDYKYHYILLFRNQETLIDYIVVNYFTRTSWTIIYDCDGNAISGGEYELQKKAQNIKCIYSNKQNFESALPCDLCEEFFRTHTLIDTIAYHIVKP